MYSYCFTIKDIFYALDLNKYVNILVWVTAAKFWSKEKSNRVQELEIYLDIKVLINFIPWFIIE